MSWSIVTDGPKKTVLGEIDNNECNDDPALEYLRAFCHNQVETVPGNTVSVECRHSEQEGSSQLTINIQSGSLGKKPDG